MKKKEFALYHNMWLQHYEQAGIEASLVAVYMEYVDKLLLQDMPVIFDLKHLCLLLGVKKEYLCSVIYSPEQHYRHFSIKKHSGGLREITAPYYSLKQMQRWILDNILSNIKVHRCAHGFKPKKSILTNVKVHVNQEDLLKLDLKDFFPSIGKNFVINVFQEIGYTNDVAFYLASICCYDDALPQGAPTSPALSNIVSRFMDNRLYKLARKFDYRYTRYADDMGFSGTGIKPVFIDYVTRIINECGFRVNEEKQRLYHVNGNKILTGISLSNGVLRLPRKTRRNWGKDFYYINRYGLESHVLKTEIRNIHYIQTLKGRLDFWRMVEPDNKLVQQSLEIIKGYYSSQHKNAEGK